MRISIRLSKDLGNVVDIQYRKRVDLGTLVLPVLV